jgi:hypothetical protein
MEEVKVEKQVNTEGVIRQEDPLELHYKKFRQKISECYKELRAIGVICRHKYYCCLSCASYKMADRYGDDTDYVYYHEQDDMRMKEGEKECYLRNNLHGDKRRQVMEIVKKYGSDWDGEYGTAIIIPAPE